MHIDNKAQHLGTIYRLIEQFELISRTDLAKLSGLAPASITNITKVLIDKQFVIEKAVQNSNTRGRPAVGLAVSDYQWQILCLTISSHQLEITLCALSGSVIFTRQYPLNPHHFPHLQDEIHQYIQDFMRHYPLKSRYLLALSVCVIGRLATDKQQIIQLGHHHLECHLLPTLQHFFQCPILINEHFNLWLLAESSLGGLVNDDNVLFLQLDDNVNLSILLKGKLLQQQSRMSVDKMTMPKFSPLSEEASESNDELSRYQLAQQITFPALCRLIDKYLPNSLVTNDEKIQFFCQQVLDNQDKALQILNHISDNLAYMLMNLINIFSSKKILLNSPLLQIQTLLFAQIQQKLQQHLLQSDLNVQLTTAQIAWNSALIPCAAIKQTMYNGDLFT